ncbi:MAG: transposase, partial [Pseudonocardiaceae bacterium]
LCGTDVAFRVICASDAPDHTTLARFRKAHVTAFEGVFAQVLALCARAGMVRLGTVAIDGTKIAANASIDANHGEEWFREQARKIAAEAEAADTAEDDEFGPDQRGDEVAEEFADPATRAERIRRCLAEIAAEQAAKEAEAAAQAGKAEQHLERIAAEPVVGRDPGGVDPVAAAKARLAREVAARQGEIDAYAAAVAAATAQGRRLPAGRRIVDPFGGKRVKNALAALQRAVVKAAHTAARSSKTTKDDKVIRRNVSDPDSRIMPTRQGWLQGFNAQFAVSADHLIVALALTNNPADVGELKAMLAQVEQAAEVINAERAVPETPGTALADAGYFSEDNLTPDPQTDTDPVFDLLIATGKSRDLHREATTNPAAGPPPEDASPAEKMRHRLRTPEGAALYKKRGATVEPVNGHIKDRNRLRRFSMRGLTNCLGELNLTATAHNISRLFTTTQTT